MTHDGAAGDRTRGDQAPARGRGTRARRLGSAGLALFVGGPVLGLLLAVGGVVLAVERVAWWPFVVAGAIVIGVVLHRVGLRLLLASEDARAASGEQLDGATTDQASPARTNPDS